MQLTIFDVGHGSCALLIGNSADVALFDVAHEREGFRPAYHLPRLGVTGIEHLVISHYDEDHLNGLPDLKRTLPISGLLRNDSVPVAQLRRLKLQEGPLTPGVLALIDMLNSYPSYQAQITLGDASLDWFFVKHATGMSTNDLSLVCFVHHQNGSIILPGDLEQEGWKILLSDRGFCEALQRVKIFVASHHGRANGYIQEVFNYCRPLVIIISDTAIQYDTQVNTYAQHVQGPGIRFAGESLSRKVLTTRNDGHIRISPDPFFGFTITKGFTLP